MASSKAVATALGAFSEVFPTRELTERTVDVWTKVLAEVDDDILGRAVIRLCRDPNRRFFPTAGELFAAIEKETPRVDALSILHRIESLGYYDPKRGWVYPTDELIREKLGDAIADAYTMSGRERNFAPETWDGQTKERDAARAEFEESVTEAQRRTPDVPLLMPAIRMRLLPAPRDVEPGTRKAPLINPNDKTPLAETIRKLTQGVTAEESA